MVDRQHPSDYHSANAADPNLALWEQLLHPTADHPLAQWPQELEPAWAHDQDSAPGDDDITAPSQAEIASLLNRLGNASSAVLTPPPNLLASSSFLSHDPELQAAFLEDITRCLGRLQPALFDLQVDASHAPSLNLVRCELHTLKGVSATVGLTAWADYLHCVEDQIQEGYPPQQLIESLLTWVERIQTDANAFRNRAKSSKCSTGRQHNSIARPLCHNEQMQLTKEERTDRISTSESDSVQLPAVQFDRLIQTVDRLVMTPASGSVDREALYQLSRQLTALRTQPACLLFRRLQQTAQRVAQSEGKDVQLTLRGDDLPLPRSLEQRLFEPLMHLVRNSVCHGIETPAQRLSAGKPACGTIRIELIASPEQLLIEIADDGKGLDDHAIRQRGIELGLLTADTPAHAEQLHSLIFHPGFSTRADVHQGAGRGMGMHIVLAAVEELGGWLEVDSQRHRGTCIRLFFPATLHVEQVLLFRCGPHMYAVPSNAVESIGTVDANATKLDLATRLRISGVTPPSHRPTVRLTCRVAPTHRTTSAISTLSVLIDQIVGTEQLVFQPLSVIFKHHPYCTGAARTACGATVFRIDLQKLATLQAGFESQSHSTHTKLMTP